MDDKRDNIFEENENNIKNEEHIEETSKNTEDEMKETSDRESMKETQKLFNNENIDEMKETVDEDFGGDYGEHIEEPYDHSIEQEIYDEPYMEDSKAKDKEFESYVDGIVQKEFEKRRKGNRLKSVSKFLLAIVLASSISIAGTSAYLKSNSGKSLLNQSSTDKGATTTTINTSDKPNVEKAVAQKSMQSVVGITTVGVSEDMFSTQKQTKGLGSGVIVSKEGYILTNNHVVDPSKTKSVTVILSDGTKRKAKVLWSDKTLDLAVIKIDPKGLDLKPVEFGDSSQVSIGDKAIAIGNPLGINLKSTLTSGYISGKDRVITLQDGSTMEGLFQTDAAINPGNSGGGLFNDKGQLIGINTAKAGNSDGIGFAIPSNLAKPILEQIIKNGKFESVSLGIRGIDVSRYNVLGQEKLPIDSGVYIHEILSGSPAESAGLKPKDIITKVGDTKVTSNSTLKAALLNYKIGDKVKIEVYRDGKTTTIEVTFSQFDLNKAENKANQNQNNFNPNRNRNRNRNNDNYDRNEDDFDGNNDDNDNNDNNN
ncbi:trypsin-like peptidase domain-containing protein [Parvimonas micra]|uniref:Trypsin-like peptidase domain-containing protein n=1 Tax=Parvimonas micra TaxID=33033 RepID=A0AAX3K6Y5_9FIRM|nr:trypsin-like peptidase domain-containing protein [Parvimonas micra]MEB3029176.1 trypsin-like peptidase domain-containing protein [Parvimonas micra]WBB30956.1 trypsin-like peptidase domain-containing protein [Parvimonas micra]